MKIIWTRSTSLLSKLIQFVTDEPVSHVSIVFDDKIVFHSNLLGVHLKWLSNFKKSQEIVRELDFVLSLEEEEALYQVIYPIEGKWYDFGALLYMGFLTALKRYCFIELKPLTNLWSSKSGFMCVEVLKKPCDLLGVKFSKDLSLMTPYETFVEVKKFFDQKH